jgi:hypothetical protein
VALLIWPISIALVVAVVRRTYMLEIALVITAGSFLVALAYLGGQVWLMSRRPQRGPPTSQGGPT